MKLHTLVLGALGTNCYILADEASGEAIVVDAPDKAEEILTFLNEQHYRAVAIVLTHAHFDHILALRTLKEATGAPILAHENSAVFLRDGIYNLCHYVGIDWTPISADKILHDGDTVAVGATQLRVLHTPGHTSDCICLYGGGILISGDTLFQRSVGRTDHPTGSLPQEVASIREKLMTLPDDTPVYPGHGAATTIGEERRENPYLQ